MKVLMTLGLVALAAMTFLAVACSNTDLDAEEPQATTAVTVDDNKFSPAVIQVDPGETVTWTFADNKTHDVAGDGWSSPRMQEGEFQHQFQAAGVYDYKCTLHPGMVGRVIVGEAPNAAR